MRNQHIIAKILFALLIIILILSGCSPEEDSILTFHGDVREIPFNEYFGQDYYKLIYDSLFTIDYEGQIHPQLVEEYEFKNATTLRLKIHEGVTFHDGTTLDATDCVDTLLRQIQNVNEIDKMKYFLNILEVHYETPYQFEIVLEEPDPYLLRYLTFGITKALNPNERTEKDAPKQFNMRDPGLKTFYGDVTDIWDIKYTNNYDTFIGSGPYVLSQEKKAVGAYKTLIAYNNYWRGEPEVKEIRFVSTRGDIDFKNAFEGLLNSEYDYYAFWHTIIDLVELNPMLKEYEAELLLDEDLLYFKDYNQITTLRLGLDISKAPLNSLKVRQAISGALDVDEIVERVRDEYTILGESLLRNENGLLSQTSPAYVEGTQPLTDQEISQLLTEAGYPDGITLSIMDLTFMGINDTTYSYSDHPVYDIIIEELAKHKIYLQPVYSEETDVMVKFDSFQRPVTDYLDYLDSFLSIYSEYGWLNSYQRYLDQGGTDKRLYETIFQLHNTVDEEERIRLAQEAVTIIQEEAYEIPLYNEAFLKPYNKKVLDLTLDTGISLAKEIFGITVD